MRKGSKKGLYRSLVETLEARMLLTMILPTASLRGVVFSDANGNNQLDEAERFDNIFPGITVFNDSNRNRIMDDDEPRTTTNVAGQYTLAFDPEISSLDLNPRALPPAGWEFGRRIGNRDIGMNILMTPVRPVSGIVYTDADQNNACGDDETRLGGVTVFEDFNQNGLFDAGERFTVSDESGNYSIMTGLPASQLAVVAPAGLADLGPGSAPWTLGDVRNIRLARAPTLRGVVFEDLNLNGERDAGEPGVADATVIFNRNNLWTLDPGEENTVTDSDGQYMLDNLRLGEAPMHVLLPGWSVLKPSPTYGYTGAGIVVAAEHDYVYDIPIYRSKTITGRLFDDLNGNGVRDEGEPPVSGSVYASFNYHQRHSNFYYTANKIESELAQQDRSPTLQRRNWTGVDSNEQPSDLGTFKLEGVPLANQAIEFLDRFVVLSAPAEGTDYQEVAVASLPSNGAVVRGRVYEDKNRNGIMDVGEKPLAGLSVHGTMTPLGWIQDYDGPNATTASGVSDAEGRFLFTGLSGGSWEFTFSRAEGEPLQSWPVVLTVRAGDDAAVDLPAEFSARAVKKAKAPVVAKVYYDLNGNGRRDKGEVFASKVKVKMASAGNEQQASLVRGQLRMNLAAGENRLSLQGVGKKWNLFSGSLISSAWDSQSDEPILIGLRRSRP